MKYRLMLALIVAVCLVASENSWAQGLGTGFTYQGRLNDGGSAANGLYDFEFEVFDDPNFIMGTPVGLPVFKEDVSVYDGHFTVTLDFGFGVFDGDGRWLEIRVRPGASVGGYTTLQPRQTVTPAPYALYAVSSGSGGGGDADGDPTNELQTLGLVGSTLSISSGNSVILPTGGGGVSAPLDLSGAVATPGAAISGTNTGSGYGLYGKHNSSNNWGLVGSSTYGVAGKDEGSGNYGWFGSNNEGVYGFSSSGYAGRFGGDVLVEGAYYDSSTDAGTAGQVLASTGSGTDWIDVSGGGGVTVPLELSGTNANPIISGSNTGGGVGVFGINSSSGNYGYLGEELMGVYGRNAFSGNYGYLGSLGDGVHGFSGSGTGVYGHSSSGDGVYGTSNSIGVRGEHSNSGNYGYLGSSTYGVSGSSDNGRGVMGSSINSYGVYGNSSNGYGVYGNTSTGTAVRGTNTGTGNYGYLGNDTYGVYGIHNSSGNYGYLGNGAYGVYGKSVSGTGIRGVNDDNNNWGEIGGEDFGVKGYGSTGPAIQGDSISNLGIKGDSISNFGIKGTSRLSYGVHGSNTISGNWGTLAGVTYGAYGEHESSGNFGYLGSSLYGVYGKSSGDGFAGYFKGSLHASGHVGIGTTDPGAMLHVVKPSYGDVFRVDNPIGTSLFIIDEQGDVGIGTDNPGFPFEYIKDDMWVVMGYETHIGLPFPASTYSSFRADYNFDATAYLGYYVDSSINGDQYYGVYGKAKSNNKNYGIYGEASGGTENYAGYFKGDVHVTGTLSKGGGSFKIDHPLDPENKTLSHSFVESPDMMNVYNGNVILDEQGKAVVEMPQWFEVLNRDFRYQLTPIGAPGPNLYIATEITGNTFAIAGGEPGTKVSWMVTGIRQDAYAEANRIAVEEDKPVDDRGLYLHPEAFGLDREKSIQSLHKIDHKKQK